MMTEKNQQISTLTDLVASLPQQITDATGAVYGISRRIRRIILSTLQQEKISLNYQCRLVGMKAGTWEAIFNELVTAKIHRRASRKTQYYYHHLLMQVARLWLEAGVISELPELTVSPQHPRRLTVPLYRMGGYRFSDYLNLVRAYWAMLNGAGSGEVVPAGLADHFPAWLGLGLILSGLCSNKPIEMLCDLHWEDLPSRMDAPMRLYHRKHRQYCWYRLPQRIWLLLAAQRYRQKSAETEELVFPMGNTALRQAVKDLLRQLCETWDLPLPSLDELCGMVRLHLRQVTGNIGCAVLMGQMDYRPVIAVSPSVQADGGVKIKPPMKAIKPVAAPDHPPQDDDEEYYEDYVSIMDEITTDMNALFTSNKPDVAMQRLESWMASAGEGIPQRNLCHLVRWVLGMVGDGKNPATRKIYWAAVRRILAFYPAKRLEEISQEDLRLMIEESDLDPESLRQSIQQWCKLGAFLRQQGLPMPLIERDALPVYSLKKAVNILRDEDVQALLAQLTDAQWFAAFLSARLGLRVGEVCRLLKADVNFDVPPCVYIHCSKGGKSRRVSLAHLTQEELDCIRSWVDQSPGLPRLLKDDNGQPLNAKTLSERIGRLLEKIRRDGHIRYHALRGYALRTENRRTQDVRAASSMAGHTLCATTVGSYLADIDLDTLEALRGWESPMNDPCLYLPCKTLAAMIGRTDRRVMQMIEEYKQAHPDAPLQVITGIHLPDGTRPARQGRPVAYLGLEDALKLMGGI